MGFPGGTLGLVSYQEGGSQGWKPVLLGSLPGKVFDYLPVFIQVLVSKPFWMPLKTAATDEGTF